jgi:hypothetical protein
MRHGGRQVHRNRSEGVICVWGEREERGRQSRGRGETAGAWDRRKAEQAARKAAVMADPVLGFYARHGHRAAWQAEVTTPGAAAGDDEPGTA